MTANIPNVMKTIRLERNVGLSRTELSKVALELFHKAGVTNLFTAEGHIAIFSSHGGPHVFAVGGNVMFTI